MFRGHAHPVRRLIGVSALIVGACGSADEPVEIGQTVDFVATEYAFSADASTQILEGETVRLRLTNNGEVDHEMQLLDENGRLIDRVPRLSPGASGAIVVTFDDAGVYQLICDIDDHLSRGQRASFRVNS